ncbi:MAG: glutaredoxin family protein [Salinibacterium sp.]|nr:MAG: glutaredoxin family protein [Salinibacterium sp.]
MSSARLTLIGKPECHLCDDARDALASAIDELGARGSVVVEELSILDDPALNERYWDEIPVVLLNGKVHTIWRVEPDRLKAAITEAIA